MARAPEGANKKVRKMNHTMKFMTEGARFYLVGMFFFVSLQTNSKGATEGAKSKRRRHRARRKGHRESAQRNVSSRAPAH